MSAPTMEAMRTLLLAGLLAWACVEDVRARRIPNRLVLLVAAIGLALSLVSPAPLRSFGGAVAGLATGFALWIPFYAFRMVGAGDVKLFAAAAAWLGPRAALVAAAQAAIAGGVLALGMMLATSGPRLTAMRLAGALYDRSMLRQVETPRTTRVPYALAITAGVLLTLWNPLGP